MFTLIVGGRFYVSILDIGFELYLEQVFQWISDFRPPAVPFFLQDAYIGERAYCSS